MKSLFILLALSSASFAQIIYAPVQYQYYAPVEYLHGSQNVYYYGGHDPLAFRRANDPLTNEPNRVIMQARPFTNGHIYGYGPDDARNEAYGNVPTYYRKSDLVRSAIRQPDGSLLVCPQSSGR